MISVDTNVVVRFLVRDDEAQAQRARRIFAAGAVFVPKTVLLETEWVLRYAYGLERDAVADSLDRISRMTGVMIEDIAVVRRALDWHRQGLDFADALHLASAPVGSDFASFDRDLQRSAKRIGAGEVLSP